jgi:serine/threonine protein kinase
VAGGNLRHWRARRQAERGRGLTAEEVLGLIAQITEGLAFAHEQRLEHRDLKPANVLMDGDAVKLVDFGIGGVVSRQTSRIGTLAVGQLSLAERASLFRGAGTPL